MDCSAAQVLEGIAKRPLRADEVGVCTAWEKEVTAAQQSARGQRRLSAWSFQNSVLL